MRSMLSPALHRRHTLLSILSLFLCGKLESMYCACGNSPCSLFLLNSILNNTKSFTIQKLVLSSLPPYCKTTLFLIFQLRPNLRKTYTLSISCGHNLGWLMKPSSPLYSFGHLKSLLGHIPSSQLSVKLLCPPYGVRPRLEPPANI